MRSEQFSYHHVGKDFDEIEVRRCGTASIAITVVRTRDSLRDDYTSSTSYMIERKDAKKLYKELKKVLKNKD